MCRRLACARPQAPDRVDFSCASRYASAMGRTNESSETAKYCFAEAIKQLMATTALDRIPVTAIVARSGLARQTFYRNFRDKYALVNWYFERLVVDSFHQMGISCTLQEGLERKFMFIRQEYVFFLQAFRSQDSNSLVRYDFDMIYGFYRDVIVRKTGVALSDDVDFLLRLYCHGSIRMTVEWVLDGMPLSPRDISILLVEALPERLKSLLSDLAVEIPQIPR